MSDGAKVPGQLDLTRTVSQLKVFKFIRDISKRSETKKIMLIAGGVGLQGGQNVVADILSALWAGDSVLHEDLALLVGVGHVNQVNGNGLGHDGVGLDSHRVHNGVVFPIRVNTALVLHHVDVHLHGDGLED